VFPAAALLRTRAFRRLGCAQRDLRWLLSCLRAVFPAVAFAPANARSYPAFNPDVVGADELHLLRASAAGEFPLRYPARAFLSWPRADGGCGGEPKPSLPARQDIDQSVAGLCRHLHLREWDARVAAGLAL